MTARKKYKANRGALIRLYRKHKGKCCYCGCSCVLPVSGYQGVQPLNLATIEHIYNNFSLIRLFLLPKFSKIKLACWECNHEKGKSDAIKHFEGYNYKDMNEGLLISLLQK